MNSYLQILILLFNEHIQDLKKVIQIQSYIELYNFSLPFHIFLLTFSFFSYSFSYFS
jgi:hypothetical protein